MFGRKSKKEDNDMTKEQFMNAKTEIAKKVLPHLVDPDGYGPSKLAPSECSLLIATDEKHIASMAQFSKVEKTTLSNLGRNLRSMGVMCAADCIPPRR